MLSIKKNEIDVEGTLVEQLTDYTMLGGYIYEELVKRYGDNAAKRFITEDLGRAILRGVKDNAGNNTDNAPEDKPEEKATITAITDRLPRLQNQEY